jgi:hypothetical protein
VVSSVEEAVLLLKKWWDESTLIVAMLVPNSEPDSAVGLRPMVICRFMGRITTIDDEHFSFKMTHENSGDFMGFCIANCLIGYHASPDVAPVLQPYMPSKLDSLIFVSFPFGMPLALFSVEDTNRL